MVLHRPAAITHAVWTKSATLKSSNKCTHPNSFRMASRAQTNGVLPIPASQTAPKMSKASQNRAGPSLKVVVRRLAPALTEAEFMKIIGEEWKVGAGRVDWFSYKPGKVSTEYALY